MVKRQGTLYGAAQDFKGWSFADEPRRYKPFKCAVCRKCYFDLVTNRCVYGGPYEGYLMPDGSLEKLGESGNV